MRRRQEFTFLTSDGGVVDTKRHRNRRRVELRRWDGFTHSRVADRVRHERVDTSDRDDIASGGRRHFRFGRSAGHVHLRDLARFQLLAFKVQHLDGIADLGGTSVDATSGETTDVWIVASVPLTNNNC